MQDLTNIKRTADDKKAEQKRWDEPMSGDDYPYGLTISLSNEVIQKLKLGPLDADEVVHISAKAFVSNENVDKRNGKTERSVSLQITDLAISQTDNTAATMYGDD